jgi:hypothetical protein
MATDHRSTHSLFRAAGRRRRTSAFLEVLEERRLLDAEYWNTAANGSWHDD